MSKPFTGQSGEQVIAYDGLGNALIMWGGTQPADGRTGFAPSCLFLKSDGTVWWNNSTGSTSANFDQITLP